MVPIPSAPVEEMKMVEVAWAAPASEPTMKLPLVSGKVMTAPLLPMMAGLFEIEMSPFVEVSVEVATLVTPEAPPEE